MCLSALLAARCPPNHSAPFWLLGVLSLLGILLDIRRPPGTDILLAVRCPPHFPSPLGYSAPSRLLGALLVIRDPPGCSTSHSLPDALLATPGPFEARRPPD